MNDQLINQIHQLLIVVLKFKYPTDKLLSNFFREHKQLGRHNRYIVAETIYTILRNYFKLSHQFGNNHVNFIKFTWLNLLKPEDFSQKEIPKINFDEVKSVSINSFNQNISEFPDWIYNKLIIQMPQNEVARLSLALEKPAPLDLRVNLIKTNLKTVF